VLSDTSKAEPGGSAVPAALARRLFRIYRSPPAKADRYQSPLSRAPGSVFYRAARKTAAPSRKSAKKTRWRAL